MNHRRSQKAWYRIGGKLRYYKSRFEAKWACVLELCLLIPDLAKTIFGVRIKSWDYEQKTFDFTEHKKHGVTVYRLDFGIVTENDELIYHEIKGLMEQKDVTRLRCLKRYYPDVKAALIIDRIPTGRKKTGRTKIKRISDIQQLGYEVINASVYFKNKTLKPMIDNMLFRGLMYVAGKRIAQERRVRPPDKSKRKTRSG